MNQNTIMIRKRTNASIDPRDLNRTQHNVLDAIHLLEREAPHLIRSVATITYELHHWGVEISENNVQTVTRGLAATVRCTRKRSTRTTARRRSKSVLPYEHTVTEETRKAIEDHVAARVDCWALDAASLFTLDEVRASFLR